MESFFCSCILKKTLNINSWTLISFFFTIDKGHKNPLGMCSSVLDLALGFLEEPENDIQGLEQVSGQEQDLEHIPSGFL